MEKGRIIGREEGIEEGWKDVKKRGRNAEERMEGGRMLKREEQFEEGC